MAHANKQNGTYFVLALIFDANLLLLPYLLLLDAFLHALLETKEESLQSYEWFPRNEYTRSASWRGNETYLAALILAMLAFAFVVVIIVSSIAAVGVGLGFIVAFLSATI